MLLTLCHVFLVLSISMRARHRVLWEQVKRQANHILVFLLSTAAAIIKILALWCFKLWLFLHVSIHCSNIKIKWIIHKISIFHMWLMGCPNPCEMQQSWEWTFLKHYSQVNTKWALKRNFIVTNFFDCDFKIFT